MRQLINDFVFGPIDDLCDLFVEATEGWSYRQTMALAMLIYVAGSILGAAGLALMTALALQ